MPISFLDRHIESANTIRRGQVMMALGLSQLPNGTIRINSIDADGMIVTDFASARAQRPIGPATLSRVLDNEHLFKVDEDRKPCNMDAHEIKYIVLYEGDYAWLYDTEMVMVGIPMEIEAGAVDGDVHLVDKILDAISGAEMRKGNVVKRATELAAR